MKTSINILLNQLEDEILRLERENARLQRQLDVRAGGVSYYIKAMCEVEKERDTVMDEAVKVSTENEELRATIATLQAHENTYSNELLEEIRQLTTQNNQLIDDAERRRYLQENNTELRAQLAQMQAQESFRMALLESVVSAARVISAAERGTEDWFMLEDTLDALDTWQPEAPPAAPASKPCSECGMYDGVHDLHCKNADDDAEWRDTPDAATAEDVSALTDWTCPGCGGKGTHQSECPQLAYETAMHAGVKP